MRWTSDWSSSSPKVLEPIGRHFGVSDRVLDVPVAEIVLQSPCVVAIIGELEPAGVAKHVWVDREWHLGGLAEALTECGLSRHYRPPAAWAGPLSYVP